MKTNNLLIGNIYSIDIETGTLISNKRQGNPWVNNIEAVGIKPLGKEPVLRVTNQMMYPAETEPYTILGFNFKYDMLYFWESEKFQNFLKSGGKIYDVQLAEFYLKSFQIKYPALRNTALSYGLPYRDKGMEEYWERRVDTKDIPKDVILKDLHDDVLEPEQIFLKQKEEITQLGIENLLAVQNNTLLALTEIENNGMYIDENLLHTNIRILQKRLTLLRNELFSQIEKIFPVIDFEYNIREEFNYLGDEFKLLLFGGEKTVVRREMLVGADGCPVVFKSGKKQDQIRFRNVKNTLTFPGIIHALPEWRTESGEISLDDNIIQQVINLPKHKEEHHTVVNLLSTYSEIKKLEKDLNTYYLPISENLYKDNCLRSTYNMIGTKTGRSSCEDINQQNIPGLEKSKVKYCFVSRYN